MKVAVCFESVKFRAACSSQTGRLEIRVFTSWRILEQAVLKQVFTGRLGGVRAGVH